MSLNRVFEKGEDRAALLPAGGEGGPDSFAPASARFAARALRDFAIDHHKTKRKLQLGWLAVILAYFAT
jgi:hypothetical protein